MPVFDGIASILIGVILGLVAVFLAYETKGLLIGEAADPEIVSGIRGLAIDRVEIDKINECLTMHMGPNNVLVTMSVDFDPNCSSDDVEAMVARMTSEIRELFPRVRRVFIEAEAWERHNAERNIGATSAPDEPEG
jgi:divalent metal cation (Fe/Co/Zn/Cd) transporter